MTLRCVSPPIYMLYLPLVPKLKVARSNKSENFLKVCLLNNEAGVS